MSARVYLEGGATGDDSKESKIRCQEAFHKLLGRTRFTGRKPRLVACGGRAAVYNRFVIAHSQNVVGYIAMWIDSEEPIADLGSAWKHLQCVQTVPRWEKPDGVTDDQVLFMTTCMETWIVADRKVLKEHYGSELHENALPALTNLEQRPREQAQDALNDATRDCSNDYAKGKRSFEVLGKLSPAVLEEHLPSFARVRRILNKNL